MSCINHERTPNVDNMLQLSDQLDHWQIAVAIRKLEHVTFLSCIILYAPL